jgi:hypothetical protein
MHNTFAVLFEHLWRKRRIPLPCLLDGRVGEDRISSKASILGILYEDNVSKKRWVLKANDPKTLEDIDAVFVTVEPNGGGPHSSGTQLLFAYLRVSPNHP